MSEDIIKYFEKNCPPTNNSEIINLSEVNYNLSVGYLNQYIVGLIQSTPYDIGFSNYKINIQERLSPISKDNITFVGWPFNGYEVEEIEQNLEKLSKYFNVEIDIPKMMARQDVKRNKEATYYLVVTVVQIAIATAN